MYMTDNVVSNYVWQLQKMTDLELDIIDSAFGRECDHCMRDGERIKKTLELHKRIIDLLSENKE